MDKLQEVITNASDSVIAKKFVSAYKSAEESYIFQDWLKCIMYCGHFVEMGRRFLDLKLFGSYLEVGKSLQSFTEKELNRLENSSGNDIYRLMVPRVMYSVNTIRNKRSIAHVGSVDPNRIDADYALGCIKWVLAEIVRLEAQFNSTEIEKLINSLLIKKTPLVWKHKELTRILVNDVKVTDKVLLILHTERNCTVARLIQSIEYRNASRFRQVLTSMHKDRSIEYDSKSEICIITPKGDASAIGIAQSIQLQE